METMICSCCGAKLVPTTLTAYLTCEYCDNSVANPLYDADAATEAQKPDLTAICLSALKEMGAAQNLASLDRDCFGDPIDGIDAARAGLAIPDDQQVYLLYSHTFLFLAFSDGLALTDQGLYYSCDSGKGSLSWEAFVTGAISCVDEANGEDGVLKIGSAIELPVKGDKDSRLARFLVDFHNHVYHQHTGETAPAAWTVTEPAAAVTVTQEDSPSLLGSMLAGGAALLGSGLLGTRTTQRLTQRVPTMHVASRPTVRQDRRDHVEPPRPLQSQPHQRPTVSNPGRVVRPGVTVRPGKTRRPDASARPAAPTRPAAPARPGNSMRPGNSGRPGSGRGPGGPGGPGKGRR